MKEFDEKANEFESILTCDLRPSDWFSLMDFVLAYKNLADAQGFTIEQEFQTLYDTALLLSRRYVRYFFPPHVKPAEKFVADLIAEMNLGKPIRNIN